MIAFDITVINLGKNEILKREKVEQIKGRRVGNILLLTWSHCFTKLKKDINLRLLECYSDTSQEAPRHLAIEKEVMLKI